ncbi:hypothetical protein BKA69DRAFT_1035505 [Paraphysoderma sedebokerense]|nr:hypothetical protein BKA69DRAFT_1035505 [Paraphysoderma sedebokerense]
MHLQFPLLALTALSLAQLLVHTVHGFGTLCQSEQSEISALRSTAFSKRSIESVDVPPNTKIAIVGDTGVTDSSREVLELIRNWGAEAAIHLGDFDYEDSPSQFVALIDEVLNYPQLTVSHFKGPTYPYFVAIGNHDLAKWNGQGGYRDRLISKLKSFGGDKYCSGDFGVNMECTFKGVHFVLSGIGTYGTGHASYINEVFSRSPATWKMCGWHKNQRLFQTGGKSDETGYEVYDMCRQHGAIVATAHEHSYCRTHLMSSFAKQTIASKDNTLRLEKGKTFSFVTGLGGQSIRSWMFGLERNPWMAAVAASNNDARSGALLCTFHVDGKPNRAHCTFKDIVGQIFDNFTIETPMVSTQNSLMKRSQLHSLVNKHTCRSRRYDIPITPDSISVLSSSPISTSCPPRYLAIADPADAQTTITKLVFKLPKNVSPYRIRSARLQVMGANPTQSLESPLGYTNVTFWGTEQLKDGLHSKHKPFTFDSRDSCVSKLPASSLAQIQESLSHPTYWTHEMNDEEWEIHEVWVSPDLAKIVKSSINSENVVSIFLSGVVKGNEGRFIYGWEQNGCLSPSLVLAVDEC